MDIIVSKQDYNGHEVWCYRGRLLQQLPDRIVVEAFFDREEMDVRGLVLEKGDRFVETYFTARWYNYYEIYTYLSGVFKGWYCNVSYPAVYQSGQLAYRDLALDLVVFPDSRQVVLDWDEFQALDIPKKDRSNALAALAELQQTFTRRFEERPGL